MGLTFARRLPKKGEILQRAKETSTTRATIHGLPSITPTEAELKETGELHEARVDLMRNPETAMVLQQRRYLDEMAEEMRLSIIPKREHREQQRKVQAFDIFRGKHPKQVKKVNGYRIVLPAIPQPKRVKPKPRKPLPIIHKAIVKPKRKRKRSHTQRSGRRMRGLNYDKGIKVFSLSNELWKAKDVGKKRKRRKKKKPKKRRK